MSRGIKMLLVSTLMVLPAGNAASVEADEIPHRTSWLGETLSAEDAAYTDTATPQYPKRRVVQTRVKSIWVDPQVADGKIYTNSQYDESAREMGVYQFDSAKKAIRPVTWLYRQGKGGTVVTGDDQYFYGDFTRVKRVGNEWVDDGQVLVRFQRGDGPEENPYTDGSIPMSRFEGGDPVASSWRAGRNLTGKPGGAVAGLGLVFLTRPEENAVYVYERERMTLVIKHPVRNPGALAFRHSTNSLFVLADDAAGKRVVQEWTVQQSGAMALAATVTDVGGDPAALAASTSRLFIADNAPDAQQVRIYANCAICPQKHLLIDKLGRAGGVAANDGHYADDRFDYLTGVGVDKDGNVYVAGNGRGTYGRLDIRRFSPYQTLDGRLMNYIFQDAAVPDPRNPSEVYSAYQKFTLDYSRTTPGQEWSPDRTQLIADRVTCPHDGRYPRPGTDAVHLSQSVAVRYMTDPNDKVERKYLYVRDTGSAGYHLGIYRFERNGVARPSVQFSAGVNPWPDGTPSGPGNARWVDGNANCRVDAGETEKRTGNVEWITGASAIDKFGTIWTPSVYPKDVYSFKIERWDAAHNPLYSTGSIIDLDSGPIDKIQQLHYVDATDTMYMYGYQGKAPDATASPRYLLARYDDFSDPAKRRLVWSVDMQYVRCWADGYNYDFCVPFGIAVAGNRVYVADLATFPGETQGRVRVFDTAAGGYKGSLYAGPEVARTAGWVDIAVTGITAAQLPNGEHVVFREEDYLGRVLMYRYTP